MTTMRALYFDGTRAVLRTDYAMPDVGAGECLVKILLAGVCATDLEMLAGYKSEFKGVLGHEFVGEVVTAPEDGGWIGQRVVADINFGCGECLLCRRGLSKHCRRRRTLGIIDKDGVFADYVSLPVANLHRVPDSLTNERAVFVEPLAAALQILEQVPLQPSDAVAVIGDGRLGLLVAQVLIQTGCQLTVFGRHIEHLEFLADLGIETIFTMAGEPIAREFIDTFDVVAEATGAESGFSTARKIVRPGGVIVLKSTFARPIAEFDSSGLVVDEVQVVGSRCGPFAPALRMLDQERVSVDDMIDGRYALDDAVDALEYAGRSGVLKVLIDPSGVQ